MMAVYIIVLTPEYPVVDQGVGRQGIATLESDHHLQSVLDFACVNPSDNSAFCPSKYNVHLWHLNRVIV